MDTKTLAIVVTYNRKQLLKECINALIYQTVKCDVLIVDNASTDGTKDFIKDYLDLPNVFYENTGANLGGAGGFNFGIRRAYEFGYDYFWLMDDDTITKKNALEVLLNVAAALDNSFGFLSSYAEYIDKKACLMNVPELAEDWYEGAGFAQSVVKVRKATFVSFFVKAETVVEVGLPIKEFFIWADDSEYSQRISKKYSCYMVLDSKVIHKMNANGDANYKVFLKENGDRAARYFYSFRNRFFIAKQNGIKENVQYFFKLIGILMITAIKAKPNKMKKIGIVLKGIISGLAFSPTIEKVSMKSDN